MVEERLCRCCRISTYRLVNLKAKVNVPGAEEKTYKDILHEMAIGMIQNIEEHDETIFPKKACNKCIRQIKQSYKFLLKVQSSYEYFMELDQKDDECGETEDSNVLLETYVEKPETHALLFEAESEVDTKGKDIGIDICRAGETELEEITIEIEQAEQFTNFETSHSEQLKNEDSFDGRQTACSSNETEKSDVESLGGKEMSPYVKYVEKSSKIKSL